MNSVERIKTICKERKIPISKLEKDLGFANAYISQLRKGVLPTERLLAVAQYLSVSPDYLLNGEENKKAPTLSGERKDVLDEIDIAFYDEFKELDEDQKATIRDMVAVMRQRKGKRP